MDAVEDPDSFTLMQHGHKDMIQAVAYNSYGNRLAIGSADGKIKVYNRHRDGTWHQCDTWGAHSGEIIELHWLPPTLHPNLIASISVDGKFRIWAEDPTIAPLTGRRFNSHSNRSIFELRSPRGAPFVSFSIKHNPETRNTYIAILGRDAMITVYENDEPENMTTWNRIDYFTVGEKPARGEEVAFKVEFDPNSEPCHTAIREGVPQDSLALIVASMQSVRIWRTKDIDHTVSLGSNSSKEFYIAAILPGHTGLVRDVAWAPGNARGFDICATVCRDGYIRVFDVHTPAKDSKAIRSADYSKLPERQVVPPRGAGNGGKNTPSGIGAGLAGVKSSIGGVRQDGHSKQKLLHTVKEVAKLDDHGGPVWRVKFDEDGQMMATTGDDGKIKLWRREPSGSWCLNGELSMNKT